MSSADTTRLNVKSDAPVDKYRTPNEDPQFDTTSVDVFTAPAAGAPVSNLNNVVTGGTGQPVSNGG